LIVTLDVSVKFAVYVTVWYTPPFFNGLIAAFVRTVTSVVSVVVQPVNVYPALAVAVAPIGVPVAGATLSLVLDTDPPVPAV
jgi:hypothetical protein